MKTIHLSFTSKKYVFGKGQRVIGMKQEAVMSTYLYFYQQPQQREFNLVNIINLETFLKPAKSGLIIIGLKTLSRHTANRK